METFLPQPKFRGMSHFLMFFVSIAACTFLILKSTNSTELISTSVYSFGVLAMFGFSALYHRKKASRLIKQRLRKLDHTGIFLMIAGTFTPMCLLSLPLDSGIKLLTIIWSVATIGIVQSIFFSKIHRLIRAAIYLIAGWVALPFVPLFAASLSVIKLTLVIAGGVVYSIGATTYGLKIPKLSPNIFGFHEFFHLLVVIAAILHFIVIYSLI